MNTLWKWLEYDLYNGLDYIAITFPCYMCDKRFKSEGDRGAHSLFVHEFYVPQCSTGVGEKQYRESIMEYRRRKEKMSTYYPRYRSGGTHSNSAYYDLVRFFGFIERGFRPYWVYWREQQLDKALNELKRELREKKNSRFILGKV